LKATAHLQAEKGLESHFLLFLGKFDPILFFQREPDSSTNYLMGFSQILPDKRGPQDRLPVHDLLPGSFKSVSVQVPNCEGDLRNINPTIRFIKAMEKHSLLYWRERV
jgi:hypothetical protein